MTIRFVTLSLITVPMPASTGGGIPAQRHLAALAMLIVEQTQTGWQFRLRSAAIGAGDGEDRLLAWATDHLPEQGIAIGWRLADDIVTPLLDAARDGDPEIAVPFLDQLAALVTAPAVDLAVEHGGAGAPPLDTVAAAHGIPLATTSADEIETAWALGDTGRLRRHASAQVLAVWRLWLAGAPSDEFPAKEAFIAWLAGADTDAGSEDDR